MLYQLQCCTSCSVVPAAVLYQLQCCTNRKSFHGDVNLDAGTNNPALYVNDNEAVRYDGSTFWWGTGGSGNYFSENVGIGTTSPDAMLHVKHASGIRVSSGNCFGNCTSLDIVADNFKKVATIRTNGASDTLRFTTGGSSRMRIFPNGDVRIGTRYTNDNFRLAVDGKIICEELRVDLSSTWPDYVFAEDYPLMPIIELEKSIKANKHLPGIPSAQELESAGVDLGIMQTKIMEKVEELTLYVIELNAENDRLNRRIEDLERN